MKTLLLMRHAQSPTAFGIDDFSRPLSAKGMSDALCMGGDIKARALIPDLILCSSAIRTRQTCEQFQEGLAVSVSVNFVDSLYNARSSHLLSNAHEANDDVNTLMIIAHNPGIYELALTLAGRDGEKLAMGYAPATTSIIEADTDEWKNLSPLHCRLISIMTTQ